MEQDYIDLFLHKRKAHMAKYVYMYRPQIYEEILKQDAYYPFKMESDLLIQFSEKICKNLPDIRQVLELGPGSQSPIKLKTVPFLTALKTQTRSLTYKAIDSTLEYAEQACHIVKDHFKSIPTQALEIDFLSLNAFQKIQNAIQPNDKKLMMAFGQPIFANNNDHDMGILLDNIARFLNKGDYLLFGIDTNKNETLLEKAYNTKLGYELLLNVMYFLKTKLDLKNFHPEAFDLIYKWDSQNRAVGLFLKATTQQIIKIQSQELIINKGQEYNLLNSRKPPIETIEKLLTQKNLIIQQVISSAANNFSIVTAHKNSSS